MTAWFGRYAAAFDAFDAAAMAAFYRPPCLIFEPTGIEWLEGEREVRAKMEAICALHRQIGYAEAIVDRVDARDVSEKVRFAEVDWRTLDTGGAPLTAFTYTYQLVRSPEAPSAPWQIVVATAHA